MKHINVIFWTVLICAIAAIAVVLFVPRSIDLPPVDDLSIEIKGSQNDGETIELQGNEKDTFYAVFNDSKYKWGPFVGNNPYYYSDELVTVFITGTNLPFHLNLYCLPKGESVYKRDPYAFFSDSRFNYKLLNNQNLFDLLNGYSGNALMSAEENQQNYSYKGDTTIEISDCSFVLEDLPENSAEESVVMDFISTITGEFDKKLEVIADTEPHRTYIEVGKRQMEEGVYIKSYVIHNIATLSEEQYARGSSSKSGNNPLFYNNLINLLKEYDLVEYEIINVDFTMMHSEKSLAWGPQWGDGTYNRSFLVGKKTTSDDFKIYDYSMMLDSTY